MPRGGVWCTLCHHPAGRAAGQQDDGEHATEGGRRDGHQQDRGDQEPAFPPGDHRPVAAPRLTSERIDELLTRLAADESRPAPALQLGPVALPPGRARAVLLAGAGGLVLLAGALLFLYLLGRVV